MDWFRCVLASAIFSLSFMSFRSESQLKSLDAEDLPQLPEVVRLTNDEEFEHRPVWHPDGKRILFARHEDGGNSIHLYLMDAKPGATPKRITKRKDPEYDAVVSPDGRQMLFTAVAVSGTQGNLDLALMPLDGTSDPKIVAGDVEGKLSHQDWAAWHPDGKRYAFNSTQEGNQEIYLANIEAGEPPERLTQSPGQDVHPSISPDGRFILFATDRWSGLELARLDLKDKSVTRLTESPGYDDYPAIAPDGKRWVFVSNRSGNPDLWLGSADRPPSRLTDTAEPELFPSFANDGKSIVFVSGRNGQSDIYVLTLP
ncbi:biopolymer transporter Tol [bacterium]|nr:biopolymer transporter Tol [bacterium]